MGCCKCEHEFVGWADPQPVVFVDPADKQEYCVFHAPKDEKRKELGSEERYTVEEFNDLVFARIDAVIARVKAGEKDAQCDLRCTVFPGDIVFQSFGSGKPLPVIRFDSAKFSSDADFEGVTFSGRVWFDKTEFCGRAVFYWATFSDTALFSRTTFSGKAAFLYAKTENDCRVVMQDMQSNSLMHLTFTRGEFIAPLFTFTNCIWPDRLGLEVHEEDVTDRLSACEELYRALKQRADAEHDRRQVSQWHAKEKEMALRRLQQGMADWTFSGLWRWALERDGLDLHHAVERLWERLRSRLGLLRPLANLDRLPGMLAPQRMLSATWWYSVSSGFGENPVRALKVLLTLIVGALALVAVVEMQDASGKSTPDVALLERLHAGLQHLLFITGPKYSPRGACWRMALLVLTRVLIPVQFGLLALAVRNRFRR